MVRVFIVYANHNLSSFADAFLFDMRYCCKKDQHNRCVKDKKCAKYPAYDQALKDCRRIVVRVSDKRKD